MLHALHSRFRRLRDRATGEVQFLVVVFIIVFGAASILLLGDLLLGGTAPAIDNAILRALRNPDNLGDPRGSDALKEAFMDVTALGSSTVLVLMTVIILGFLFISGRLRTATFVVAVTLGGAMLNTGLKHSIARVRPVVVPQLVEETSYSFPSGHAQVAAIVFLTLGVILSREEPTLKRKRFVLASALGLTLLVGFSRVYLGVHYATDVLGGWTIGLGWLLACWAIDYWLLNSSQASSADSTRHTR